MVDSRKITDEELKKRVDLDPVLRYEKKLLNEKVVTQEEITKLKEKVHKLINEAAEFAKSSKLPDKSTVKNWVYAS